MESEILNCILSKIGDYLLDATIRQIGYIYHFKTNIEDVKEEDKRLRSLKDLVQQDVDNAVRNTEEIKNDVNKWLSDAYSVMADVEELEKEMQVNKTCLYGWCPNWFWRYKISKKAAKKTKIMLELEHSKKFDRVYEHRVPLPGVDVFAPKGFMPFDSTKPTLNRIVEALKDDKTNAVGLYGMGGVGKTTLAKVVEKRVIDDNLFDKVVMVVVSQTPNPKNIQDQIADLLTFEVKEKTEQGRARRLYLRLREEKRILIILDDVWAELDLTTIGIPFGDDHKGCKIFLTTRRQHVCTAMRCQHRIPLNVLNEKEGLSLLKSQAGISDESPTLNDMAIKVAGECKGLPLAIVSIGSALKRKKYR